MPKKREMTTDEKLDKAIELLKHLLAVELAREGVSRQAIAKHTGLATATVVRMLKGVKNSD
jgi:DNA-binding IclR family transcriptional regulator